MAMTPEGRVKAAVVRILRNFSVYYFFPATHGFGRSGIPDVVACVRGRFVSIECKADGGKLTALQAREISRINEAGGIALVIDPDNTWLLVDVLKKLVDGGPADAPDT